MTCRLIIPDEAYKESFWQAREEFLSAQDPFFDRSSLLVLEKETFFADFETAYRQPILNKMKGIGLKPGYVPASHLWLVNDTTFLGATNVRYRLTDALIRYAGNIGYEIRPSERGKGYGKEILRQALDYARTEVKLDEALVTCDARNEASYRTIIAVMKERGGRPDTPTLIEDCTDFPNAPYHPVNQNNLELRFWIKTRKDK